MDQQGSFLSESFHTLTLFLYSFWAKIQLLLGCCGTYLQQQRVLPKYWFSYTHNRCLYRPGIFTFFPWSTDSTPVSRLSRTEWWWRVTVSLESTDPRSNGCSMMESWHIYELFRRQILPTRVQSTADSIMNTVVPGNDALRCLREIVSETLHLLQTEHGIRLVAEPLSTRKTQFLS